ncbi:hypothetical protein G7Y89_g14678 [Cudoniella acicularis]|uniref:Heterokaryon incompatibility domain-containing protein n=1 Tax=Cudoniella acicularis TaxID=354080 RepID=A0A8H4VS70_9HELO|nr:hypothetical protein G7Y89_g14678 [Cudoniella acicularis]
MDLNLIVPVKVGQAREEGDEELNGTWWRVTGPHAFPDPDHLKFHCISYAWGPGKADKGSLFNCKIEISDQTKPALEAAIRAASAVSAESGEAAIKAFWIDAICIPQLQSPERLKTLESMGFIYSAAASTIVILQDYTWGVIKAVGDSWRPMTSEEMQIVEQDGWASRVWTYQELVNSVNTYFTAISPTGRGQFVSAGRLLDCVGISLRKWQQAKDFGISQTLITFPNLNHLSDSLLDWRLAGMIDRSILGVLSNMNSRNFDPDYPGNRILACMGAISQDVSWGPESSTLAERAEKLMRMCEAKGDYSFIYTSDIRDDIPGKRWRPNPHQPESTTPVHLLPIATWHIESNKQQAGRLTSEGLWLDDMVRLELVESISVATTLFLQRFLYGMEETGKPRSDGGGIYRGENRPEGTLVEVMLHFLKSIGYEGHHEPQVCERGLFYSQINLSGLKSVELYAASRLAWVFGKPGLARWMEEGSIKYCAGIFVGALDGVEKSGILL